MKLLKDTSGFGIIELLLILISVVIFGFVGWRVYDSMQDEPATVTPQAQPAPKTNKEVGADDSMIDPTDYLEPYKLPAGWTEKECKPGHIAIVPPKTDDPNCEANQPNTTVLIYLADNDAYIDPEDCVQTKTKKMKTIVPADSTYECANVVVGGKKGVREIQVDSKNGFAGKATYVSYLFPADGKILTVTYGNVASRDDPDYTKEFDTFAKSLKFQ